MVASFSGRSFFLRRGGLWPRMKCWWKHLKRLVKWSQRLHQWEKWNGKRQKEWILWTCYRSVLRAFYCRKNVDENIRQARCRRRSRRNEPIERDGEIIKKKNKQNDAFCCLGFAAFPIGRHLRFPSPPFLPSLFAHRYRVFYCVSRMKPTSSEVVIGSSSEQHNRTTTSCYSQKAQKAQPRVNPRVKQAS